jgi:hypothetical protein
MAQNDKKGAFAGVIAPAAAADAADGEGEQLELMPPTRASMTDHERARVENEIRHSRRGRPPGARNKATREMLDYLRKTMGDPALRRFQYAMYTPEALSIEVGCSKFEALQFLDRLWADLSGYFYGKQAQVDSAGAAVAPRLTMVFGGQNAVAIGPDGAAAPPWKYIDVANAETQQNQALLASPEQGSHGEGSHDPE